jgi:SAM-dependent methyltransferase
VSVKSALVAGLKKVLPRNSGTFVRHGFSRMFDRGRHRYCPVCERFSSRFLPFPFAANVSAYSPRRPDALCPKCDSLERHRLVYLYFQRKTDLFSGGAKRRFLHVAPEGCFQSIFRKRLGASYVTGDLMDPDADLRIDLCDIDCPDESFDILYCSHVLEHVPDDKKAMREMGRVLKKEGWAIILVPITAEATEEDPTLTDPREKLRRFGQADHCRRYGPDFINRLREAGFVVSREAAPDFLSSAEIELMGITAAAGEIYFCRKGPA